MSMLSEDDVAALLEARHADPFAVPGTHADVDGDLWVRGRAQRRAARHCRRQFYGGSNLGNGAPARHRADRWSRPPTIDTLGGATVATLFLVPE
ncbi:MAG TPA: hypothetical protein VLE45_07130 [Burkholderiaceae bacterium]|nr:hypothetical protein [Burkholderiaceae bacterium]